MPKLKKLIVSGLLAAFGIILPQLLHAIPNAGAVFLPMHIPVLLCGLICGWQYGLACGIITPLLSYFITGMPPTPVLPGMLCELAVYGLVSGLVAHSFKPKNAAVAVYVPLVAAMICGRATYGVLNALIFRAGAYSFAAWVSAALVTSWIGILIQLALIPAVMYSLKRAGALK